MNAPLPVSPVNAARVLVKPDQEKRRDPKAGEEFRRALQEHGQGGEAMEREKAPAKPAKSLEKPVSRMPLPRALQQKPAIGRQEPEAPLRHVDVLA
ncbi:MAG: hypothetical protein ABL997_21580 [Planctomycetota bacterium]